MKLKDKMQVPLEMSTRESSTDVDVDDLDLETDKSFSVKEITQFIYKRVLSSFVVCRPETPYIA